MRYIWDDNNFEWAGNDAFPPFIFGGNNVPERNLITKIVVNSTTTDFSLKRVKNSVYDILPGFLTNMFLSFSLEWRSLPSSTISSG